MSTESSPSSDLSDYPLAKAYGWVPHSEGKIRIEPAVIQPVPPSVTRSAIEVALAMSETKTEAARMLGINRTDLYRRCKRLGIEIVGRGGDGLGLGLWQCNGV